MILDFEYKKKQILISEIDENGDIKINYYPWSNPMKYEVTSNPKDKNVDKKYKTWDGKYVRKVSTTRPNRFSIYEFLDRNIDKEDRDRLFKFQEPKTFMMDIETEILPTGFVEPIDATSKVLNIAIVQNRKVFVLGIRPLSKESVANIRRRIETHFEQFNLKCEFQYMTFHNRDEPEKEMLRYYSKS